MADECWNDEPSFGDTYNQAGAGITTIAPELPEIKLFGRWSCDDVQIKDMSLEVIFHFYIYFMNVNV